MKVRQHGAMETIEHLRAGCSRFLTGHGRRTVAEMLAEVPEGTEPDRYGAGGVVEQLETEVAELLGKPAAAFFVSGTMAQQIALRVHADRSGRRVVAYHPTSHLELHEGRALERLHGLFGRPVGDAREPLSAAALAEVAEPVAALLLELPQREIGGRLVPWDELVAQVEWARSRGAAVHLDGARLWESTPFYDRTPAEVAALFDTVYVSFYKGLGGVAGACLAGPADHVGEAREWRARHGGTLFGMWPYAATALGGLRRRLPRMPEYVAHARAIAVELAGDPDVEVVPAAPVTPMMHVRLRTTEDVFLGNARRLAADEGVWTFPRSWPTESETWRVVELTVGDATLQWPAAEAADVVRALVAT